VLRDHRQALIQEKLEAEVIHSQQEWPPPQTDELALIGRELGVPGHDRAAEEGHRALALVEYYAKPGA
jgi:hypothetical protein